MPKDNILDENLNGEDTKDDDVSKEDVTVSVKEMQRRLAAEKSKYEKKLADLHAEHELEKQKAKMSKEEKKSFELSQKEKELETYKAKVLKLTLSNKATSVLSQKGISANEDILSYVIKDDEDSTLEAIDNFANLIDGLVNEKLKESARQTPPTDSRSNIDIDDEIGSKAELASKHRII